MIYRATSDFWYHYRQLPIEIQDLADKGYELLKQDSRYPSLHFKKVGLFWSVRFSLCELESIIEHWLLKKMVRWHGSGLELMQSMTNYYGEIESILYRWI